MEKSLILTSTLLFDDFSPFQIVPISVYLWVVLYLWLPPSLYMSRQYCSGKSSSTTDSSSLQNIYIPDPL